MQQCAVQVAPSNHHRFRKTWSSYGRNNTARCIEEDRKGGGVKFADKYVRSEHINQGRHD